MSFIQFSCSFTVDENAGVQSTLQNVSSLSGMSRSSEALNYSVYLSSIIKLKNAIISSNKNVVWREARLTDVRHFIIRTDNHFKFSSCQKFKASLGLACWI